MPMNGVAPPHRGQGIWTPPCGYFSASQDDHPRGHLGGQRDPVPSPAGALSRSHPTPGSACQGSGASRVEGRGKVICVCRWRVGSIELEVPISSLLSLFSSEMCQGSCLSPPTQLAVPFRVFCGAGAAGLVEGERE